MGRLAAFVVLLLRLRMTRMAVIASTVLPFGHLLIRLFLFDRNEHVLHKLCIGVVVDGWWRLKHCGGGSADWRLFGRQAKPSLEAMVDRETH